MIEKKHLGLLQFDQIIERIQHHCFSSQAKLLCQQIVPLSKSQELIPVLEQNQELKLLLTAENYFPDLEHEDIELDLNLLGLEGAFLSEAQLLRIKKTINVCNGLIRFIEKKNASLPYLSELGKSVHPELQVPLEIERVIDEEMQVRNTASKELAEIRQAISDKRRESDKRFYNYLSSIRKLDILRESEEGFFNGRRTLAVMIEHKSAVNGFVHSKSESGKTIFIEPAVTVNLNNEVAELEIDEHRELNRVLRELCAFIRPNVSTLKQNYSYLIQMDFMRACAKFAIEINATLPKINFGFEIKAKQAVHPLLYLQNKRLNKPTVPLNLELDGINRIMVVSGPNAGGKTIALKTIGLLQVMLQSGLLIPVNESSSFPFFDEILVDMGDTQSIENELSTYSAKLLSMTRILNRANEGTLVLMDEFGSGTDPDLGSAISEAVLESLVNSKTKGIITSHFGNVKILADQLDGTINASMLFDLKNLSPKYLLNVGQPGSSYTFEVAERIGFPKQLIERAKTKVDKEKVKLNRLLAEVQEEKIKLEGLVQKKDHERFLKEIAKEKYLSLYHTWEERMNKEREEKLELLRLAELGKKYEKLLSGWSAKKDRKLIIKNFIDGLTAQTKKAEVLKREKKHSQFAEKKIAIIKSKIIVGSRVKVLNSSEVGVVEAIKDEKVIVQFGILKITVGMENLLMA